MGQGRYDVSGMALLETRVLTVELPAPGGWIRPVNEVSVRINAGESVGLVAESDSGKTMLSLALMDCSRSARENGPEIFSQPGTYSQSE